MENVIYELMYEDENGNSLTHEYDGLRAGALAVSTFYTDYDNAYDCAVSLLHEEEISRVYIVKINCCGWFWTKTVIQTLSR